MNEIVLQMIYLFLQSKQHIIDYSITSGSAVDLLHWSKFLVSPPLSPKSPISKSFKRTWVNFLEGRGFRSGVGFPLALFYK